MSIADFVLLGAILGFGFYISTFIAKPTNKHQQHSTNSSLTQNDNESKETKQNGKESS